MDKGIAMKNLCDMVDTIEHLNKNYFITDGTLLGAVRGGGFIDFDEDVDIGVFGFEWSIGEFAELTKILMKLGFVLYHSFGKYGEAFEVAWRRDGVKVDMFFYWKRADEYIFHAFLNGGRTLPDDIIEFSYPLSQLCPWVGHYLANGELKIIDLVGRQFKTPCDPIKFLETKYGPDWRTPTQQWNWATSPLNRTK